MDANIPNIKCVSVKWWLYVLSNALATFETQFIKKLSNAEVDLKMGVAYENSVYFIVNTYTMV